MLATPVALFQRWQCGSNTRHFMLLLLLLLPLLWVIAQAVAAMTLYLHNVFAISKKINAAVLSNSPVNIDISLDTVQ